MGKREVNRKPREYFVQRHAETNQQWETVHSEQPGPNAATNARKWLDENAEPKWVYRICRVVTDEMSPVTTTKTVLRSLNAEPSRNAAPAT